MKLHEALRDALGYLEMCEQDPHITSDMITWFDEHGRHLVAINALRFGNLEETLNRLDIAHTEPVPDFEVCDYGDDDVLFKEQMNEILGYLVSCDR